MDKAKFEPITYREDLSNYMINRKGQIYSLKTKRILKGAVSCKGYLAYTLKNDDGKTIYIFAHIAVAKQYIPKPVGKDLVNHKDENKLNPSVDNLEWITTADNIKYGTCQKRRSEKLKRPISEYTLDGKYVRTWKSAIDIKAYLEERYWDGIPIDKIWDICKAQKGKAFERYWKYYDGDTNDIEPYPLLRKCYSYKTDGVKIGDDVPEFYLYREMTTEQIKDYFMKLDRLTDSEKKMLLKVFK